MTLLSSEGTLRYTNDPYKLIVAADEELSRYYRKLIGPYNNCKPQRYTPHLSIIRHETPIHLIEWGHYEGETITFEYDPTIQYDGVYWWLNCFADRLCKIREGLGLPAFSELARPPDGRDCFHLTLGNSKP